MLGQHVHNREPKMSHDENTWSLDLGMLNCNMLLKKFLSQKKESSLVKGFGGKKLKKKRNVGMFRGGYGGGWGGGFGGQPCCSQTGRLLLIVSDFGRLPMKLTAWAKAPAP